jgi:hypothetical protein
MGTKGGMRGTQPDKHGLIEQRHALRKALAVAQGYMTNAAIDLETGAPKKTALATINGGLKQVREAIKAADDMAIGERP